MKLSYFALVLDYNVARKRGTDLQCFFDIVSE